MHTIQQPESRADWSTPVLLLGVAAFLYANLFYRPGIPYLLSSDQVYFWTYAQRMFYGERAYVDFFEFLPAGTNLVFLGAFKMFGIRIAVLNCVVLVLGLALCWVFFRVARRLLGRALALLATLLFLTLIFTRLLNATHHFFAMLAILCAILVMLRWSGRLAVAMAGTLLGCASFFTQTHGAVVLVAFSVFFAWEASHAKSGWRSAATNIALLWACFAAAVLLLNAHFLVTAGLGRLWDLQVGYPLNNSARGMSLLYYGLPERLTLRRLAFAGQPVFVYLMLPVVYAVALFRCWLDRGKAQLPEWRMVALLALTGLVLLFEVAVSPNWLRVYTVSAPGIILFVWLLGKLGNARRYALWLVWAAVFCMGAQQVWSKHHHEYIVTDLPSGTVAADPIAYEKLSWFKLHTSPGDFFLQAGWLGPYVPLSLRNPVYADVFRGNSETRPEFVGDAIRKLESKQVHYILWSPRLNGPDLYQPGPDHLGPLRAFLHANYHQVWAFSDLDEVWERN